MTPKLEESEVSGIKYLKYLVLNRTAYYNPKQNKFGDIYSQNCHKEMRVEIEIISFSLCFCIDLSHIKKRKNPHLTGLPRDRQRCLEESVMAANLFPPPGVPAACGQRNKHLCLFLHLVYVTLHWSWLLPSKGCIRSSFHSTDKY